MLKGALLVIGIALTLSGCSKEEIKITEPPVDIASSIMENMAKEVGRDTYVKFQDRMSMDWDSEGSWWLEKCAEYHGGNIEDRCYTILVTLNKVVAENKPISEVVMEELYDNDGITAYDFEEIVPSDETKEALRLVMMEGFDNSYGSVDFIEFNKEQSRDAAE